MTEKSISSMQGGTSKQFQYWGFDHSALCSTVVPAIRYNSGTKPAHNSITGVFADIRQPVNGIRLMNSIWFVRHEPRQLQKSLCFTK
jgi:hypothetical protein